MAGSRLPSKAGFIPDGRILYWSDIEKHADYVRQEAIKQFIYLYRKVKDRTVEEAFVWGDEIEHILVKLDDAEKTAKVLPQCALKLQILNGISCGKTSDQHGSKWMPEHGAHQLESTPGRPFSSSFSSFNMVENNMKLRRRQLESVLDPKNGEKCLTMTQLPRFGCQNCYFLSNGMAAAGSEITKSPLYPDALVNPFGRYISFETNIRLRRGENVSINVPVFKDINTESPFWDPYPRHQINGTANTSKVNHIHADCSVAACSCSCLQVTFQASDLSQAKYLHDQLIPMCPIMLALSASTPVFRGFLSNVDCRWNAFTESVDSRNKEERGIKPLKKSKFVMTKGRCDSVSFYLTAENEPLNDSDVLIDDSTLRKLVDGGVDIHMARYISCILNHDPVVLYEEKIRQDSEEDTGHFNNIFATNWLTLRLKPPAVNDKIGWRVEFRPLEVQMTEFEKAAYVVFIILLARSINEFKLDLAAPISKVDLNIENAQALDAVVKKKFYFRENIERGSSDKKMYTYMSIDIIINGGVTSSGTEFPGLIPIINRYINTVGDVDDATRTTISRYLQLISDRAAGRVKTTARWIRDFVAEHPDYKYDSVISERINYDLVKLMSDISNGTTAPQHLNSKEQ